MNEVIVFPDAVALLIGYLDEQLDGYGITAPVHRQIPEERPAEFVRVLLTGGVRDTLVTDTPQVTFEAWAATAPRAHDIAQIARALVNALPGRTVAGVAVYRVDEFGGPVDLPDPASGQQRFTWTATVAVRGEAFTGS